MNHEISDINKLQKINHVYHDKRIVIVCFKRSYLYYINTILQFTLNQNMKVNIASMREVGIRCRNLNCIIITIFSKMEFLKGSQRGSL